MEAETRYSLNELAELTGVEVRTVRWYISEGLLRGPESMGRNAYYTDHHRKRLETIRTLKEVYHLPLKEIRRYVLMAGDEDIQIVPIGRSQMQARSFEEDETVLSDGNLPPGIGRRARHVRERAQQDVLGDEELAMRDQSTAYGFSVPVPTTEPMDKVLDSLRGLLGERRVARQARAEERYQIPITPEVGLYVNGPFSREQLARFEMLADILREMLLGGVEEGDDRTGDEDSESR